MTIPIDKEEYNSLIQDRHILNYLISTFPTEQRLIIYKWRDKEATPNEIRKLFGLKEIENANK